MRLLACVLTVLVVSLPAAAQGWKEYADPGNGFTVSFPAAPRIETTTYQAADGSAVQAKVYSVTQDGAMFKMTVADLSHAAMEESAVIDHAIKTLSQGGEIKVNIPARINRVYGRQLSIVGADGSHSSVAVFYHKARLYQIEGKAQAAGQAAGNDTAGNDAASYAIRFQQSLVFTGGDTNRPDAVREARRNCPSENAGAPAAGPSDDRQLRAEARCRRGAR
jgi:hypothetical protein